MQQTSTFKSRWQEYSPMYLSQVLLLILITADYTLTTNINHQLGNVFYLLVLATLLFIILPLFKFYIAFKQRYAIIIGHYIVIGIFLCFFANIDSAYYFLLFFYLTVSMYWYGWRGYYSGLAAIIGITLLARYVQFPTFGSAVIYHVGMYFAILVISTLYIALLMHRRPIEADPCFLLYHT